MSDLDLKMNAGSASVIMASIAFIYGIFSKLVPQNKIDKTTKGILESVSKTLDGIENLMETQQDVQNKMLMELELMREKTSSTHNAVRVVQGTIKHVDDQVIDIKEESKKIRETQLKGVKI